MYDIIIIGAGPAGLSAAIYARRAEKKTLVLESLTYGGQIINAKEIENYPAVPNITGYDFAKNLYNQAKELQTEFIFEKATEIKDYSDYKEVITKNNTYKTKSIIIATGVQNKKLDLPNEEKLIGKGISYCATCDGAFYKNKDIAVVGGGNTALEDALYLSHIAKKVYLIHRRDKFRGSEKTVKEIKEKENIEIIFNSTVTKLNSNDFLESIEITSNDGNISKLDVSGLFIAIGQTPRNESFSNIIKLDEHGYIIANEKCETNIKGIFVAGDTRTKSLRQLVTAVSDGAIAATNATSEIN